MTLTISDALAIPRTNVNKEPQSLDTVAGPQKTAPAI